MSQKTVIIITIITVVGTVLVAFITNFRAIFPPTGTAQTMGAGSTPVSKLDSVECESEKLHDQQLRGGGDTSALIKKRAERMKTHLLDSKLDCVEAIAKTVLLIDQYNGHGLYFMGEVWNKRSKRDTSHANLYRERMRENFSVYIDTEGTLVSSERNGIGAFCYRREKGYCAERTAWISHLMAIDFYEQAQVAPNDGTKVELLQKAQRFSKTDLAFGGFLQIVHSKVLDSNIRESLHATAGK